MSDIDHFSIIWYVDYLGIGYSYDRRDWSVYPIFSSPSNAKMLWNNQIEPLDEHTLKMRFVEYGSEYNFILYPFPFQKDKINFGLYRRLSSSESYNIFKRNFSGRTFFAFGTIGDGSKPATFNKTKLVSDVKFMKNTEVKKNSIEWIAEKSQAARRRK